MLLITYFDFSFTANRKILVISLTGNVTMKHHVYALLEFYNDIQIGRDDGDFYDQKFVEIMLCGILGIHKLAVVHLASENKIPEIDLAIGENHNLLFTHLKCNLKRNILFQTYANFV